MKRKLVFVVMVVALLCCSCGAKYECSRCKAKVSEVYYDPLGSYEYLCEDCAKDYFSPFPCSSYKVK